MATLREKGQRLPDDAVVGDGGLCGRALLVLNNRWAPEFAVISVDTVELPK